MNFIILENIGDNVCQDQNILNGLRIAGYILLLAKLFIPILIIGYGTYDLYKSVLEGTTDSIKKQLKSIGYRIIIGLFIFFLPTLLNIFLSQLDNYTADIKECQTCLLDPFKCKKK